MIDFLHGMLAMAAFTVGLFFLRYWRMTRDSLFLYFCVAFWLLAANWTIPSYSAELVPHAHVLRFLGFALIAYAVFAKNRSPQRG
ncbi:MAG: hypothetical protein EOO73_11350 [Myxococcales bacterium]|nr:MAG: hypothetical protein EOO73_11350 [Myxococcales bacterium]